jgi:hypothetical protein
MVQKKPGAKHPANQRDEESPLCGEWSYMYMAVSVQADVACAYMPKVIVPAEIKEFLRLWIRQ